MTKKTVFSTHSQVAHAWALQDRPFGRSPTPSQGDGYRGFANGSGTAEVPRVRFAANMFYSYDTPVARLEPRHDMPGGLPCLLTVPNEWGPATRGHIADAVGATRHLHDDGVRHFEVPCIGHMSAAISYIQESKGLREDGEPFPASAIDHVGNLEHLRAAYHTAAEGFRRKRGEIFRGFIPGHSWQPGQGEDAGRYTVPETISNTLRTLWAKAGDYAQYFGPLPDAADWPKSFAEVDAEAAAIVAFRAEREARALAKLTPKELAKREAAKAERARLADLAKRARYAGEAENLAAWREGARVESYRLPRMADGSAHVRAVGVRRNAAGDIVGGTLETSQGARVPLVQAIRVFRFLKCVRDTGEAWEPKGLRSMRVGDFHVNRIEADGSFRAGCHAFAWPEVERQAKALGVDLLPCEPLADA